MEKQHSVDIFAFLSSERKIMKLTQQNYAIVFFSSIKKRNIHVIQKMREIILYHYGWDMHLCIDDGFLLKYYQAKATSVPGNQGLS